MTTLPVTLRFVLALCEHGSLADMAQAVLDSHDVRLDPLRLLLRDILRDLTALGVYLRNAEGAAQIDSASLEAFFLGVKGLCPQEMREEYTLKELAAIWRAQETRTAKSREMAALAALLKTHQKETPCADQPNATAAK